MLETILFGLMTHVFLHFPPGATHTSPKPYDPPCYYTDHGRKSVCQDYGTKIYNRNQKNGAAW